MLEFIEFLTTFFMLFGLFIAFPIILEIIADNKARKASAKRLYKGKAI